MNTIAASSQRIPRPALIGIVVLVVAFAALMIVRTGVLSGSASTTATPVVTPVVPTPTPTPTKTPATPAATPKLVLLPNLPPQVAHGLRYSKVVVVSLYTGQAPGDHAALTEARTGARAAGAGFVAVNVGSDKTAASITPFVGAMSSPSILVVRRPGRILTRISGQVESAVVAQAAHNAGARR